jgi:hypothetical protein
MYAYELNQMTNQSHIHRFSSHEETRQVPQLFGLSLRKTERVVEILSGLF